MPNPTFQAIIGATNESAAAFRAVRTDLGAVRKEADLARAALVRMDRPGTLSMLGTTVKSLGGHFSGLNKQIGETHGMLSGLFPALAGLGALGSIPGLFELVDKVAEARTQLIATADKLGITTDALAKFDYVARMTRVPVEAMEMGMSKLNKQLGDIVLGKKSAAPAVAILSRLGFTMKQLKSGTLTAADVLPKLADAFKKTESPALKAAIAQILFAKGGQAMIPMLNKGGDEIREYVKDAERLQYAFTPEDDKNLENYHQSMIRLETSVGALGNSIASSLTPALTPMINEMTNWITVNREWITQGIKAAVLDFANLPWKAIGTDIETVGRFVGQLVTALGGVKNVVEGLLALALGKWALGQVTGLLEFAGALRAVNAAKAGGTVAAVEGAAVTAAPSVAAKVVGAVLPVLAGAGGVAAGLSIGKEGGAFGNIPTSAQEAAKIKELSGTVPGYSESGEPAQVPAPTVPQPSADKLSNVVNAQHVSAATELHQKILALDQLRAEEKERQIRYAPPSAADLASPAATLAPPALPIGPGFGPLQITPPAFPSPYAAGGAATGGPGPDGKPAADGKLDIVITVPNLPPGGAVSATASGGAPQPVVDVGHANPFGGF